MDSIAYALKLEMEEIVKRRVDLDESLVASGAIDSFDYLELDLFVKTKWGVELDTLPQPRPYDTVNDIVAFIKTHKK